VVGGFFPIDGVGKLGRAVILAVFINKGKPLIIAPSMPLSLAFLGNPFALPARP
jgi:hypothetical protein